MNAGHRFLCRSNSSHSRLRSSSNSRLSPPDSRRSLAVAPDCVMLLDVGNLVILWLIGLFQNLQSRIPAAGFRQVLWMNQVLFLV